MWVEMEGEERCLRYSAWEWEGVGRMGANIAVCEAVSSVFLAAGGSEG